MRPELLLLTLALGAGCATAPPAKPVAPPVTFPADALITQRAVLTVRGREFALNGYLARHATEGQRLVITENFGAVLADLRLKPDGAVEVLRSSALFPPDRIERYLAADVRSVFGPTLPGDAPVQVLATNHFRIHRRAYQLDLRILEIKCDAPALESPQSPSHPPQ
jgi:hypothetical protein